MKKGLGRSALPNENSPFKERNRYLSTLRPISKSDSDIKATRPTKALQNYKLNFKQ